MQVLVTGGAGYIGSVISDVLVRQGHRVVVYDDLSRGHRDAVPNGAAFVHASLLDATALGACLDEHRIDAVVHMAANSLVGESMENPAKYYRNNLQTSLVLIETMRERAVDRLVFSSTVSVYGAPESLPISESTPTAPVNPYGDTKLAVERALHWYDAAYRMRFVSLRYFNAAGATTTHGERHDPETHLIPLVLEVAAGQRPEIVVFGDDYSTRDGTCVRDYIHVEDLARAHVLALDALADRDAPSRIYNLGRGHDGTTVQEVIAAVREVTGHPVPTRIGSRRPGDPAALVASAERIERELGWRAERSGIDEIVDSAWRWLQQRAARPQPETC